MLSDNKTFYFPFFLQSVFRGAQPRERFRSSFLASLEIFLSNSLRHPKGRDGSVQLLRPNGTDGTRGGVAQRCGCGTAVSLWHSAVPGSLRAQRSPRAPSPAWPRSLSRAARSQHGRRARFQNGRCGAAPAPESCAQGAPWPRPPRASLWQRALPGPGGGRMPLAAYCFLRAVGKGSYGEVSLARHRQDRKQVPSGWAAGHGHGVRAMAGAGL